MKEKTDINTFEVLLYFIFWITSISYSIYAVIISANEYFLSSNFVDTYEDFSTGWYFLSRIKDVSDNEWKYVKNVLINLLPWCFIHVTVAEFLRRSYREFLVYWYTTISFVFISLTFGIQTLIYFSFQPILGHLFLQFQNKTIIWLYYIMCLTIINYIKWLHFEVYNMHNYFEYITTSGIFWINLRSLNYFLYAVQDEEYRKFCFKNIITSISYCLYLPFLFTGPLVLFSDFKNVFVPSKMRSIKERIQQLIKKLLRYIFWAVLIDFLLHYVYINALTFHPQIIKNLNSWALYGAGYCMGQFFHMKYVVFYGLSTSLANYEGISVPDTPKCIGRIHLYSDMWKYFDKGLYLFLLRYIYIPISGNRRSFWKKIVGSFMCFFFVYVWHGIQSFIAIWSLLNFIGVTTETIVYEISQIHFIKNLISNNLSNTMHRRLKCVMAAPLFAMSAISNFYFFAGREVGDIYVDRFLKGPFWVTINIMIVLYFGSQVSMQIKLSEESKKSKKVS